jgi:hypothetical protein
MNFGDWKLAMKRGLGITAIEQKIGKDMLDEEIRVKILVETDRLYGDLQSEAAFKRVYPKIEMVE